MQTAYLEAVAYRPQRVLGRQLHAFCFYDCLALEIAGNPLVTGELVPDLADLRQAVLLCSEPDPAAFLSGRASFQPGGTRSVVSLSKFRRWLWAAGTERLDFAAELAKWSAHRAANARPQIFDAGDDSRELRAPWILSAACFLEMHSNMAHDAIMRAPLPLMLWKHAAIAERLGTAAADIMSDEEIAIMLEQQEFRARAELEAAEAEAQHLEGHAPSCPTHESQGRDGAHPSNE